MNYCNTSRYRNGIMVSLKKRLLTAFDYPSRCLFMTFGFRRWFSTTLAKLINCNSCGIKLQNENPKAIGYYIKPKKPTINKLQSLEDVKYLLFSQEVQHVKEQQDVGSLEELKESMDTPLICKRCNDALHKNQYDLKEFGRYTVADVLEKIPRGSNVLHIVPLPEFPFHFEKSLLEVPHFNTSLLLTKGDQLAKDKSTLQRRALPFFKDFFRYQLNIITNKTVTVSAMKKWNIPSAYAAMNANTYLVGDANVGKSTLINSLMQRYLGYKIHTDRKGQIVTPEPNAKDLKNIKQFFRNQSAGVSHIPNMTRNLQGYRVGDKFIYDLPGFTTDINGVYYEDIIQKDWLERTRKTEKFDTKKLKKQRYDSVKGTEKGNCYTLGGIFFWRPAAGTVNQIISYIPGEGREFGNIDRGLEVFRACKDDTHPLAKFCGVLPHICQKENYVRHIIPPFQGSIEVVLKNIGYVVIKTTGKYQFRGLHEFWVPRGIDILVREPLELLISEGFWQHSESKGKIPACPKNRPIVSSTYIMDPEESDLLGKMKEMYLERTSNDISSRRFLYADPLEVVSKLHEERPNLYWYYGW
ncbi:hypothetical protein ZYGR_0AS04750 [Zygosaccharomyces rouxii]|uniref:Genetic interactor of prohibitins 3, mitochondrial n=1 Tax=Zygosaccharomyces rouxii TaxID=4956 RepID=A0A1Q3AHG7_ZYGRO|nr:hypothetical protein ZYGR_0AS04750 [Zygosaccharomyces rouxii]